MNKAITQDDTFSKPQVLEPLSVGALNDLLRQQLDATPPVGLDQTLQLNKKETLQTIPQAIPQTIHSAVYNVVDEILNSASLNRDSLQGKLNTLFDYQKVIFEQADIPSALRTRQYITSCGLVMSPADCITTQKDVLRVNAYIRAIDQAIKDVRVKFDGKLHIVYPASGPFAPLLLPLIAYYQQQGLYSESELGVSLIDMQQGAIISLESLIQELDIAKYINGVYCQDATEFTSELPIHMVILEAMQHGFSREGHFSIARYFANTMEEDGVLIPEEVSIQAVLAIGQEEFNEQWKVSGKILEEQHMLQEYIDNRIELGDILRLNLTSLRSLTEMKLDADTALIECNTLNIPQIEKNEDQQILLICTRINTYGEEYIGEYDSGITHPLPDMHVCVNFVPHDAKPGDLLVKSGDKLKFFYRLNGLPGFLATIPA